MSTQTQSPFTVLISKDRLCVTIQAAKGAELGDIAPADILAALEADKVVVDDQVTRRVQEYMEALRSPDGPPEGEFQIAAGRPLQRPRTARSLGRTPFKSKRPNGAMMRLSTSITHPPS